MKDTQIHHLRLLHILGCISFVMILPMWLLIDLRSWLTTDSSAHSSEEDQAKVRRWGAQEVRREVLRIELRLYTSSSGRCSYVCKWRQTYAADPIDVKTLKRIRCGDVSEKLRDNWRLQ